MRLSGIADGESGDGFPIVWDFEDLFCFGRVKPTHLVNVKAPSQGFDAE